MENGAPTTPFDLAVAAVRGGQEPERAAKGLYDQLTEAERLGLGKVATVIGRFWSLDREEHWDRIEKTYRMLVEGQGQPVE